MYVYDIFAGEFAFCMRALLDKCKTSDVRCFCMQMQLRIYIFEWCSHSQFTIHNAINLRSDWFLPPPNILQLNIYIDLPFFYLLFLSVCFELWRNYFSFPFSNNINRQTKNIDLKISLNTSFWVFMCPFREFFSRFFFVIQRRNSLEFFFSFTKLLYFTRYQLINSLYHISV